MLITLLQNSSLVHKTVLDTQYNNKMQIINCPTQNQQWDTQEGLPHQYKCAPFPLNSNIKQIIQKSQFTNMQKNTQCHFVGSHTSTVN